MSLFFLLLPIYLSIYTYIVYFFRSLYKLCNLGRYFPCYSVHCCTSLLLGIIFWCHMWEAIKSIPSQILSSRFKKEDLRIESWKWNFRVKNGKKDRVLKMLKLEDGNRISRRSSQMSWSRKKYTGNLDAESRK